MGPILKRAATLIARALPGAGDSTAHGEKVLKIAALFAWCSRNIFCNTNSADAAAPHLTGKSVLTCSRHERRRVVSIIPNGVAFLGFSFFIQPRAAWHLALYT